ncbi:hypothetical protein ZIOFF_034596 [Zingiber officinale]|uniref:Uncharacterized protein n=1 Tax=Zingiber officinale TaxID=94328 RepID=A0A8J5GSJ7_ZINOF|nr:hypothetical protein ZIOFF_034596 [Zingiber officinale]
MVNRSDGKGTEEEDKGKWPLRRVVSAGYSSATVARPSPSSSDRQQVGGRQRGGRLLHYSARAQHQVLTLVAGVATVAAKCCTEAAVTREGLGGDEVMTMGEKGLFFRLNKIAYTLIFVITGGWILLCFVSPALGLYQLDSAPLPPSAMFKGAS